MTIRARYRIVDVFSDRPLAGNALCVVLDPLPEPVMQAVAREVNLSETAFPVVTGDGEYDVRIFTPMSELPFAGHPTLGTAWVLGPGRWTQTSTGATVTVDATGTGAQMTQPDPVFNEVFAEETVAALGLPNHGSAFVATACGIRHLLVPTERPIDRLAPDLSRLEAAARKVRCTTTAVFRRTDEASVHVRVFVPGAGIPEDPGTGAAAGPISVLARRLWSTPVDVTIQQGAEIGRPCRIDVHAEEGAIRVGGSVTPCAEGTFTL